MLKTAEKGRAVKHGCRPLQSAVDPPADNTKAALSPTAIMHVTHTHPYLRQMRFQLLSSSPFFNLYKFLNNTHAIFTGRYGI